MMFYYLAYLVLLPSIAQTTKTLTGANTFSHIFRRIVEYQDNLVHKNQTVFLKFFFGLSVSFIA